ncbi:hypothetical protein VTN02DRAFT_5661 [Thermoascus thermophilus]
MIDHVLGRPSSRFRKIQVFAVVSFWSLYLFRGNKHGPPGIRAISSRLSGRLTPWQSMVITVLWYYVLRNFAKIVGLECPEPLANLYSRSYFRATWVTTALDAGFWTAMKVKPKWLRDLASLVFSTYYLIAAEQADEKARRFRATLTVDHVRVSWEKSTTPYLAALSRLVRPRFTRYHPRAIRIPRPPQSSHREPVDAWLYFDGPLSALKEQTCIVLDIPGGGFVAMSPRNCDDKLLAWAGKTGVPVLSIDYKKAPEYPYPYALNECYDVYHTLVRTRGRCVGLSGETPPSIVLTGDSAGGNLAAGVTLMVLQSGGTDARRWQGDEVIPPPDGLVLIYPVLDMNIGGWMTEEQMSLVRDKGMRETNKNVIQRKSDDYYRLTPSTPRPLGDGVRDISPSSAVATTATDNQPREIRTRLAVSSMISYFNDRVLSPELMRALIILYIGPNNRPDFTTDFLLSPVLAPEALLARFPKTYMLTGERDPLVDDTVIFAGRLRQAKLHRFRERQELGLEKSRVMFNEKEYVEVTLLPGVSHGFLNFASFFPNGWKHIDRCARWINELFTMAEAAELKKSGSSHLQSYDSSKNPIDSSTHSGPGSSSTDSTQRSRRRLTSESSGDEDRPLEMRISRLTVARTAVQLDGDNATSTTLASYFSAQTSPEPLSSPTETIAPWQNGNRRSSSSSKPLGLTSASAGDTRRQPSSGGSGAAGRGARQFPLTLSTPVNDAEAYDVKESEHLQTPTTVVHRNRSLMSLPSSEDLLHRRMNGLAGGLMGIGEGARTP